MELYAGARQGECAVRRIQCPLLAQSIGQRETHDVARWQLVGEACRPGRRCQSWKLGSGGRLGRKAREGRRYRGWGCASGGTCASRCAAGRHATPACMPAQHAQRLSTQPACQHSVHSVACMACTRACPSSMHSLVACRAQRGSVSCTSTERRGDGRACRLADAQAVRPCHAV